MGLTLYQCVAQHLMVGIRGLRKALDEIAEQPPQTYSIFIFLVSQQMHLRAAISIVTGKTTEKLCPLSMATSRATEPMY